MTEPVTAAAFAKEWRRYLLALRRVAERQLSRRKHAAFEMHLLPLLGDVFDRLLAPESVQAVRDAVAEELRQVETRESIAFLLRELTFFAEWQGTSEVMSQAVPVGATAGGYGDTISADDSLAAEEGADGEDSDAVDAGKTIKDSAEDLITKLPDWLKRLLEILNELLSIIRGGS